VSWGRRGLQQEDVAHRVADRPWFFLQRKASTMSVSCATRCSTPRPSSSVTSSSTALRAWAAPSNAPCASQVGMPGGQQVGRGKEPRSPALQALAFSVGSWHSVAPEFMGGHPEGSTALWLQVPPLCPADLALLTSASALWQRDLLTLLPPCAARHSAPAPALLFCSGGSRLVSELRALSSSPFTSLLPTPPPSSLACPSPCCIRVPGWRGQGQFCQPNSPAPRLAAGPGKRLPWPEASLRGSAGPPSCRPDGSRCAWGSLAFPCLPLTSVVCHGGKPTLGRAPGGRGSLKGSPPRHTAASGPPPVYAQGQDCLVDSCFERWGL